MNKWTNFLFGYKDGLMQKENANKGMYNKLNRRAEVDS